MTYLLLFFVGASGWTLAEYLTHRFSGHGKNARSNFAKEHLQHHALVDYFAPPAKKAAMAIPSVAALAGVSCVALGASSGAVFTAGFVVTYIGYEILHKRLHTHGPSGPWGRHLRRHHFAHHFDDARLNHGVTSSFWDRVFGTYAPAKQLRVPAHRAPIWLRPDEGQPLSAELSGDYTLVARHKKAASAG
jgi:sterol desaturase/sphingolipid hydroxylase (fatty acid hydroxylase superfamily)